VSAYKATLPRILEALASSSSVDPRNSQTTPTSASSNALPLRSSGRHKPQHRGDDLAVDNYEDENKATNSIEMRAARVSMDSDIEFIEEGVKKKKPMANYAGKKKRQLIELVRDTHKSWPLQNCNTPLIYTFRLPSSALVQAGRPSNGWHRRETQEAASRLDSFLQCRDRRDSSSLGTGIATRIRQERNSVRKGKFRTNGQRRQPSDRFLDS
jgi:hypothetical protein